MNNRVFESQHLLVQNSKVLIRPWDRQKCIGITYFVMLQSIVVFVGSVTILKCFWEPEELSLDIEKLARISYLYDSQACGYNLEAQKTFSNIQLSNDTQGLKNIIPIKWTPPLVTVSSRLSAKTRTYVQFSIFFHAIWMLEAMFVWVFVFKSTDVDFIKKLLKVFLYSIVFMCIFDVSMAIVNITYIKQSLTNAMVLRYSGWIANMRLDNYDNFAGWLPMVASACWLRGGLFFILNIYCCRTLKRIGKKIRKREIKKKYSDEKYEAIPEVEQSEKVDVGILIYRNGEKNPYVIS